MKFRRGLKRRLFKRRPRSVWQKRAVRRLAYKRIPRSLNIKGIHYFKRVANLNAHISITGPGLVNANTNGSVAYTDGRVVLATSAGTTGINSYFSFSLFFSLAACPNASEFTSLFDNYRIRKVVVKIIPYTSQTATQGTSISNFSPILHYHIDKDDSGTPIPTPGANGEQALDGMRQRNNYKMVRMFKPHSIVIKPRRRDYDESDQGSVLESRSDWLNTSFLDIPHRGLKMLFEAPPNTATAAVWHFRGEVVYYLQFKGVQ